MLSFESDYRRIRFNLPTARERPKVVASLFSILLLALGAWFWYGAFAARERATALARARCENESLQFLDGTVTAPRARLVRHLGRLQWRRDYGFDYLAEDQQRRRGRVVLVGLMLIDLRLDERPAIH